MGLRPLSLECSQTRAVRGSALGRELLLGVPIAGRDQTPERIALLDEHRVHITGERSSGATRGETNPLGCQPFGELKEQRTERFTSRVLHDHHLGQKP